MAKTKYTIKILLCNWNKIYCLLGLFFKKPQPSQLGGCGFHNSHFYKQTTDSCNHGLDEGRCQI